MRVLMVVEATLAGVGRHVLDLAGGLLDAGHEVHLLYSGARSDSAFEVQLAESSRLQARPIEMARLPHPSDLRALWQIRKYMRDMGPFDIVHGHSSKGGALARLAAIGTSSTVAYTPNGISTMNPGASFLARQGAGAAERLLSRATGVTIGVSPEECEHLIEIGIQGSKVRHVANGIPQKVTPSRSFVRSTFGIPDRAVVFGFVGRLESQKAPEVLVDAFCHIARRSANAQLVMVGTGSLEGVLKRRVGRSAVSKRVHWLGAQDGRVCMAGFDVFVLPSRYEGMPYVLIEALDAGLPIVTTSNAGCRVLVQDGRSGYVVPVDDPFGLARAMGKLLDNESQRRAFGEEGKRMASGFTVDRMTSETLRAYRSVSGSFP